MNWMGVINYGFKIAIIIGVLEIIKRANSIGIWLVTKLPFLKGGESSQALGERLGALISSLPFVTILIMAGLWFEKQGDAKIANHAWYTFWFVMPTLPMFLLIPWMMNRGLGFWLSLGAGTVLTFVCFALTAVLSRRLGVELW